MPRLVILGCCLLLVAVAPLGVLGVETVMISDGDEERTVIGEILVEAQDGGLMLQADDGRIWTLQPKQIIERKSDDTDLEPIDADEMEKRLLQEMPEDFKVFRTQHYIVVYNSNEAYAKQVASLFENLYRGFFSFWKNQRWELSEPRFPLVAVVLKDDQAFLKHAGAEIGDLAKTVIGYYHLASNRMTTYNVPNLERNVSTIIHEATHQLAYNTDVQRRFADNPMWVSEGLATFFESPDRRNPSKWRSIGRVNQVNLARWRNYQRNRPQDSLATLLADDMRYKNQASANDAYGEGWALTYFLIKTKRQEYVQYLRLLSQGKPLAEQTKRQRIDAFEQAFKATLGELDKEFVTYMRRVR